ncbi:hypothetical protein AWC22_15470 [Mycobacterium riyadhense]|uniref:Uncharacterized protein n=1 Tax=Mycobacterium riyadhense TaxID=486698 RepID=A0A1X2D641_9MYCO|nr:hypothetical protein AWC22_15470 [Mycobacterium riyadhense]
MGCSSNNRGASTHVLSRLIRCLDGQHDSRPLRWFNSKETTAVVIQAVEQRVEIGALVCGESGGNVIGECNLIWAAEKLNVFECLDHWQRIIRTNRANRAD